MVEEFEPVQITSGTGDGVKRVPLFQIDDVVYDIPEQVPPTITMRMLRDLADGQSHEHTVARAVEDVIGRDAMDALADNADITKEQFDAIWKVVERMVLAAQEDTVGKRRPVPRR